MMARPYKSRPITKTNQLVLRLTDKTIQQLREIVASSTFATTRVAVIERAITDLHERVKKGPRK